MARSISGKERDESARVFKPPRSVRNTSGLALWLDHFLVQLGWRIGPWHAVSTLRTHTSQAMYIHVHVRKLYIPTVLLPVVGQSDADIVHGATEWSTSTSVSMRW